MPPRAEPVEGVLLDFAGTLFMPEDEVDGVLAAAESLGARLDRAEAERLAAAYDRAGRPGGPYPAHVPPTLADAYARRDLSSDEHRTAYVGLLETVEAPVPGLAAALYERVRLPEGFVPYADTPWLLGELRARGLRTALVSNIGFDLRPVLAGHGLAVDAFALSCELGVTKPDARVFHAACEAIGVPPARALMVGDHVADGGAADAGLRTLLLPMTPAGGEHGLGAVPALLDALAGVEPTHPLSGEMSQARSAAAGRTAHRGRRVAGAGWSSRVFSPDSVRNTRLDAG